MKKLVFLCFIIILAFFLSFPAYAEGEQITLYFFNSRGCPHCAQEKVFLDDLQARYPQLDVKNLDISSNRENIRLLGEMYETYDVPEQQRGGLIPITFLGQQHFLGFRSAATTGQMIETCLKNIIVGGVGEGSDGEECPEHIYPESFSIGGKEFAVSKESSLTFLAVVFGLVDGVNPCMFSVLLMLLAYLLAISSDPEKAFKAGALFGFCVFLIYFVLMAGVYQSLQLFQQMLLSWVGRIKLGFGIGLLAFGLWMVKDFFLKRKEIAFAIPAFAKPIIARLTKRSTLPAVVALALFSSLVELPCTFALPLGYTAILSDRGASPYLYLAIYNLLLLRTVELLGEKSVTLFSSFGVGGRLHRWLLEGRMIVCFWGRSL